MHKRTRGIVAAAWLAGATVALSGCEGARSALGMDKQSPDEFSVVTRAPLTMPPDFGLRPPAPGRDRPQEETPRSQARDILLKNAAGHTDLAADAVASGRFTRGEAALLGHAGALDPDPGIRVQVDRESTALVDASKGMFDKLLFWQQPAPPGKVVDAAKESQRLREARALGTPPDKGDVPVIQRREKGWLEGLF